MSSLDPPPLSLVHGNSAVPADSRLTVVWVGGDQDASTVVGVTTAIESAAAIDDAVVVDLSGVTFMDTSVIRALLVVQRRLAERSQSLLVRSASPAAARLLQMCGLPTHVSGVSAALSSWVGVPATEIGPR